MNQQQYKNIAFWIMIIAVIGLCIYLLFYIKTESYACMSSPLTYGVSHLKTNLGQIICNCNVEEETCDCPIPQTTKIIYVTKDNIFIDDKFDNLNFSIK